MAATLASVASFTRSYPEFANRLSEGGVLDLLEEATSHLEDRTSRRLVPFSGYEFTDRLSGLDPDDAGDGPSNMPMDMAGSLGTSFAQAIGASDLVRQFFLDESAPSHPELWTYDIESITITTTVDSIVVVDPTQVVGPFADTGLCKLRLGTFAPVGSLITVVYGGGYTVGIPASLRRACRLQAYIWAIQDQSPRQDVSGLKTEVLDLIATWVR